MEPWPFTITVFLRSHIRQAHRRSGYSPRLTGRTVAPNRVIPNRSRSVPALRRCGDVTGAAGAEVVEHRSSRTYTGCVSQVMKANGEPVDEHTDTFGVRTFKIRDRHLLINGERVRLTGIARHEDFSLGRTRGNPGHDATRLRRPPRTAYDPHTSRALPAESVHSRLCGPAWNAADSGDSGVAVHRSAALGPEGPGAGPTADGRDDRAGRAIIPAFSPGASRTRALPARPAGSPTSVPCATSSIASIPADSVSFADDTFPKLERAEQSAANDADFLMMNQYFGTWHGPASALAAALDKVERLFPGKMVIISEFGYPGFYAKDPPAGRPQPHSDSRRIRCRCWRHATGSQGPYSGATRTTSHLAICGRASRRVTWTTVSSMRIGSGNLRTKSGNS